MLKNPLLPAISSLCYGWSSGPGAWAGSSLSLSAGRHAYPLPVRTGDGFPRIGSGDPCGRGES